MKLAEWIGVKECVGRICVRTIYVPKKFSRRINSLLSIVNANQVITKEHQKALLKNGIKKIKVLS